MKEIIVSRVRDTVARLCIEANKILPDDIKKGLCDACLLECNSLARSVLSDLKDNIKAAEKLNIPVCQDTGMAVVFLEIGQDVHLVGGNLYLMGFGLERDTIHSPNESYLLKQLFAGMEAIALFYKYY